MNIIDGQQIAAKILEETTNRIQQHKLKPKLAIVMIGNNPASLVYINKKKQAGEKIGVEVEIFHYEKISESDAINLIENLNKDKRINAIIIQMPVTEFNPSKLLASISPDKDVDGLNPLSLGMLWHNNAKLTSATALAVIEVLEFIREQTNKDKKEFYEGRNAVVINRSVYIGKPLLALLSQLNLTVTLAHSKTKNLTSVCKQADILISGTGVKKLINQEFVKKDAIVIDVGFIKEGKTIFGDIDMEKIETEASWLSPVPNGIGPIGVAMLIKNTVTASEDQGTL